MKLSSFIKVILTSFLQEPFTVSFFLDTHPHVEYILNMDKKEKVEYWLDIADYDLETAKSMLTSGRYLYVVFMCQQAIEKMLKALYINLFDEDPPRSHNLAFLFNKLGIDASDETMNVFNSLSAHYINNRYPEYKNKLSTVLDQKNAEEFLTKTERTYTWLKSQII